MAQNVQHSSLLFVLSESREDKLFVTGVLQSTVRSFRTRSEYATGSNHDNQTYRSSSNGIELNTEYKLSERTRAEERRRNRAPGFLRGLAPTGCAVDDLRGRCRAYMCAWISRTLHTYPVNFEFVALLSWNDRFKKKFLSRIQRRDKHVT